ncbi:MAG: hypothetical protein KDD11_09895 [Acidobacteria bacterium]|nr:hypothetical protein [Acidobacteriota bacterium]
MPTLASLLMAASALVVLFLGTAHLVLTYRGKALHPRDPELKTRLEAVSPVITRQTTMWKAWIGFNASHSYSPMLFGLVYGYLALARPDVLFGDAFLLALGLVWFGLYIVLARLYFFRTPLLGILVGTALYVAAVMLGWR